MTEQEQLELDAKRYRFLASEPRGFEVTMRISEGSTEDWIPVGGEALDREIDAALAKRAAR